MEKIANVLAVSANSKEDLLKILSDFPPSNTINNDGNYRLIIFDPTFERIEKAKKLIDKDKPWKGRQDIWFSNDPVLNKEGKIAFLFPGFDSVVNPEIKSISEFFNYPISENNIGDNNKLLNQSLELFNASKIIDNSLKKLGIYPDMNAGHSLGEWFAIKASDLVSESSIKYLLQSMIPDKFKIEGIYFIAVASGKEKLDSWLKNIPDLYLSMDNCPSQILLCGTEKARDLLLDILRKEKIFYQVLPFESGFHTPFIKKHLHILDEALENIQIQKSKIPLWSATTLDLYPENFEEFKELTIKHLTETVRFRELIEKLYYQEKAKVFIQIGIGNIVGFVDDILKTKNYSAISTCISGRSTLEQLKRVLALLYIEGKEINFSFLGINNKTSTDTKDPVTIKRSSKSITAENTKENLSQLYAINNLSVNIEDPVERAWNENIKEMMLIQDQIVRLFKERKTNIVIKKTYPSITEKESIVNKKSYDRTGNTFTENLYVSLEEYPYLIDHSLFKQPENWKILSDINPVIPMTMTLELLMEAAQKQNPSQKVLKLGPVSVFQWMKVNTPFDQKIEGIWKSKDKISLKIKNFVSGEVQLGNNYPVPESKYLQEIDWGENIVSIPSPEIIYKKHMFHGPSYQGILEVKNITRKGLRALIKKSTGKGSLLDNIGQLYGLYLQLTLGENSKVSFPVKIEEINFFQEVQDQQGVFECICLPTSFNNKISTADIIIKRENKIWCIIKGWKNQIFEGFDKNLWNMTLNPDKNILAKEISPNVYFFNNVYNYAVNWNFLMNIYLNEEEKKHYDSLLLNKKKDYLISRIALKDNVRKYIETKYGKKYFPIEINIQYDANNKPSIYGLKEASEIEISLAHKGTNSVSIVSKKPVGIDIEIIEERETNFLDYTLTNREKKLLKDKNVNEWSTRFWVAKEAYGKMLGVGLKGNPKQYEIQKIEGEDLIICNTMIKTIKYNNYIIGWTL